MKSVLSSRRSVLRAAIGVAGLTSLSGLSGTATAATDAKKPNLKKLRSVAEVGDRIDAWLEVDSAALHQNVQAISAKANGNPVLAVLKCNGYGLGTDVVASILERSPVVWGFAVAKTDEAIAIREAGVRKPVLLMSDVAESDALELLERRVSLAAYGPGSEQRFAALAKKLGRPAGVHLYLDVGLGRLGVPYYRAEDWIAAMARNKALRVEGTFVNLTEVDNAGIEHLARLQQLVTTLRARGVDMGKVHAAASYALMHYPGAAMDMVRPGIMTYGVHPDRTAEDAIKLRVAHRLRARVIRVSQLRKGDAAGYAQEFVAGEPTWTATIMCGWSDGYDFKSNVGGEVLIGERRYPVVMRTANHCVVNLGRERTVEHGAVATLVGPEPGIRPLELAEKSKSSGYNQIRYSAMLPKFVAV